LWIEDRLIELLGAIAATSPIGRPSFTELVERALDEFVQKQLGDAATKERVEKYLKSTRVVKLRKVQK